MDQAPHLVFQNKISRLGGGVTYKINETTNKSESPPVLKKEVLFFDPRRRPVQLINIDLSKEKIIYYFQDLWTPKNNLN